MNDYITLDNLKYKTTAATWVETEVSPRQLKRLLSSKGDVTFSASAYKTWKGEIVAEITARSADYGTLTTLEASLREKSALSMIDHKGNSCSVYVAGIMEKRSATPDWEGASNKFYIPVEIEEL